MGVLSESLCFCKGVGKSERMKAAIFTTKSQAMARISGAGTGFLIHRNLLLTTHVSLPSVAAAEAAEIQLQNSLSANLFPHRFFITSSVLDLTSVGLDAVDGDSNSHNQQPQYIKTCTKPNLDLGSIVYLLGYTDTNELTIGEGKVVIATDNLIKLSTDGVVWGPGSAGFDAQGNLAFMICDPMKLATSPNTKSCSTSSSSTSSTKKDMAMQFGIPIPIICDWLNQHWEGSLDELNKPKLPIIRLMSTGGLKTEHSCASFTLRRVFKPTEAEDEETVSDLVTKQPSCSVHAVNTIEGDSKKDMAATGTHQLGIPSPEIYESRKVTSMPVRKKENGPMQLLDINFPPRFTKPARAVPVRTAKELLLPGSDENWISVPRQLEEEEEEEVAEEEVEEAVVAEVCSSTGSVNGDNSRRSQVQSCSSPLEYSEEETLYSAETAESRNYTSPRREAKLQQVGRSQSCVSYTRWVGPTQQRSSSAVRRAHLEKQRSFLHGRKVHSQGGGGGGGGAALQRSNDFLSPTVSSIMKKKKGGGEQQQQQQPPPPPLVRPRQTALHSPPKWVF